MPSNRTDVLVIGAGCIGVTTAYFLAQGGARVTLIDQGEICAGCSYGNAGQISPSHSVPLAAPGVIWQALRWMVDPESPFYIQPRMSLKLLSWLWQFRASCTEENVARAMPVIRDLSLMSIEIYDKFNNIEGVNFSYAKKGVLKLFLTDKGREDTIREAKLGEAMGLHYELLDKKSVQQKLDGTETRAFGGMYFPSDVHILPSDFVYAVATESAKKGVSIQTSTTVLGFEEEKGNLTGVKTTSGTLKADNIVLAAGSWSPKIVETLDLNLPIQPAKGYSLTFERAKESPPLPLLFTERKVFMTPMGDKLRIGGTLELAGMNLAINQRRVDAILRATSQYLPTVDLGSLADAEVWSGLRPATPDGLPLVGRTRKYPNLVVAAGHAMIGMSTGPATGLLVSQMVLGEKPFISAKPLDPARFN